MRWLRWLIGGYVLLAALTRLGEAAGVQSCGCAEDCWCKRPVLSTFRWVFPWRHRGVDRHEKEDLATASA